MVTSRLDRSRPKYIAAQGYKNKGRERRVLRSEISGWREGRGGGGRLGGKKKAGRRRGLKQMEGITSSHLSTKLPNIISDVFFVSIVVFPQHSAQRNSVFCCHQARHVTQRIAQLSKQNGV